MKKQSMRLILIVLLLLAICMSACTAPATDPGTTDGSKNFKIALLLPGTINDASWNSAAYNALMELEAEGYEVTYSDQVANPDIEEMFRNYASKGYDLVLGHGFQFGEPSLRVSPEFPDTYFFSSGVAPLGEEELKEYPNAGFIDTKEYESAYVSGYLAAAMTKTGVIGFIAGSGIPVQVANTAAFVMGAADMNPEVKVLRVISGDFNNPTLGREIAMAMIDNKADVICNTADSTGLAAIEAASENGAYVIGYGADQKDLFPADLYLTAGLSDAKEYIKEQVKRIENGTFGGEWRPGMAEGVVYNTPMNTDIIPADIVAKVEQKIQDIKDGTFVVEKINDPEKIPGGTDIG